MNGHMLLEQLPPHIASIIKPKHIILFEADHATRLARSKNRNNLSDFEVLGLSSPEKNQEFIDMYKKIVTLYETPRTIIDSSGLTTDETVNACMDALINSRSFVHKVPVDTLVVDFEPKIYPSTAELRSQDMNSGYPVAPIIVTRKCDSQERYINIVTDGRHRAYAAKNTGRTEIDAYVNYETIEDVTALEVWPIDKFGFK
jgi:hypothetical protein